ncbi:MAG: TonB-dependent receptor, partial [bacterium]|nr:TonB-dependent receptor [bacterium]
PRVFALETLEVTADPVGQASLHRNPAFVTVLDRSDFDGRAVSVSDVLASATGVQVKRLGGLGAFSTVSIRGASAEQVEIYLDGIPLHSTLGGGVNLGNLPLAQVAQVEVYRGAAAGGNGMGGTVHIRTLRGKGGVRWGGSGSWGAFDTRGLNAMVAREHGAHEFLVLADYTASDSDFLFLDDNGTEYNPDDDALANRQNSDFVAASLLGKWAYRSRGGWRVKGQENLYWKHLGIPGISNNQSRQARLNTFRSLTEFTVEAPELWEALFFRQRIFWTHQSEAFQDPQGEIGIGRQDNVYRTRSLGFDSRLQSVWPGGHVISVEGEVRRDTFLPRERIRNQANFFESSRWTLEGRTALDWTAPGDWGVVSTSANISFRRDRVAEENPYLLSPLVPVTTTSGRLVTLRAGLRLDLTPWAWFKANVGKSHRAPTFYELFGDRGGVVGNTSLEAEKGVVWDAGIRLEGETGSLEAAIFEHRYSQLIQFVQISQGVSRSSNIGKARVRGMEWTAQGRVFDWLSLSGNYTFQRALDRSRFLHRQGKQLPNRPAHEAQANGALQLGDAAVFYEYTFEDGNFLDRANLRPIPARHIHNTGIRWTGFAHFRFTVEAKNLLNNQVADLWGYPLPGRSYFLTVQKPF